LAEALVRQELASRGRGDVEVSSAGTAAWDGSPASDGALLVAMEHQLDLSGHRSRPVDKELLASQDLIFAMGPHHLERLEALGAEGKAYLLTAYTSRGATEAAISDPFGGDLAIYRQTFEELTREAELLVDRLLAEQPSNES
jgi:protein-tyrosine phosphatase